MSKRTFCCMLAVLMLCIGGVFPAVTQAAHYKVLVVFSYEESYPTTPEYKEGLSPVLSGTCDITYFYMDTKKNVEGGPEKAKEAYALYEEFQPDGVIAADDNAQSMFVVPYLKDKVKIPVMFCGVNAEADQYGYPASNVSGILERLHISESIAFVQQLVPSVSSIGFLMKESPVANLVSMQVKNESQTYTAKSVGFNYSKTIKDVVSMTETLKDTCDLLYISALQGISDESGNPLAEKDVTSVVVKTFGKAVTGSNVYHVKYGALCAIVQRMQEQGEVAAKMLLKAMQGTPVSQIPITRNQNGKAMVNVAVLKALGIKPDPMILHSAELVKTEE